MSVKHFLDPGAFQDNRLNLLDERINEIRASVATLFGVLHGIERSDEPIEPEQLSYILYEVADSGCVPLEDVVAHSLQFLAHPALGLLEKNKVECVLSVSVKNAVEVIQSLGMLIEEFHNGISGKGISLFYPYLIYLLFEIDNS